MSEQKLHSDEILRIVNLHTQFKSKKQVVKAVDGIDLSLKRGEIVGIVGESGSGKSVSLFSSVQLVPPPGEVTKGQVLLRSKLFGEVDVLKLSPEKLRKIRGNEIAMIFQEPMSSLNPIMACGEQVAEVLRLHKKMSSREAKKETLRLFDEVQLPRPQQMYKQYPHQISGGQKQRVMIAMAMACNPAILMADEPTTALDVTVQANILRLMDELRNKHQTSIIFVTHDLGVIAEIADRVMVMYKGKIVESGTVWDIFSNPKHPYTKGLLACRPRLDLRLKVLPTVSDFMEHDLEGELVSKSQNAYNSVGQALLLNVESKSEMINRRLEVIKGGPILRVKNLKTYFPIKRGWLGQPIEWVKAVDNVSFEVFPGETVGLVGESGCGKTTLGRTILRLVDPTDGLVFFEDKVISYMTSNQMRKLRRDIQVIFQDPYSSLNPRKSVGEAILEPMKIHNIYDSDKERKEKVYELLAKVNLEPSHYHRYPHEFSGGQRQRVSIARALAVNPKFIICDESVSALDVSVQAQVLNLLNKLKEEYKFANIFISHDLSVVKFIADRILVMKDGKLIEMGFPEALFERPREEYTKALIKAIPKGDPEDIKRVHYAKQQRIANNELK